MASGNARRAMLPLVRQLASTGCSALMAAAPVAARGARLASSTAAGAATAPSPTATTIAAATASPVPGPSKKMVTALVDEELRRRSRVHHTATHLLQSALKRVLGPDTCQQGSLVNFQRLRFDFNLARGMTAAEVAEVERLVNGWVAGAAPLTTTVMALDVRPGGEAALKLQEALGDPAAVLLASRADDGAKVNFVAALSPGAVKAGLQAGKVVGAVAKLCGGGGGGKPALAQAGGKDASKTAEALELARQLLGEGL
ncbi:putative alanine--tRNA ligase, chloroplastic [Tetrabaena socialis]|uniref:Alanine--tRNA ligase n=1 Tax=Tetrabaena socialis TaxID=47790 RepID=A0A2J8ADY2_9CHLO|nr:putative alanine--tRNA ligase, chloroplastic [Tetrabaena socialis]|eukprot:PNH10720.1 putative alanine--tRNA ligase, chloroplastic [Tetrabaena socialis]